MDTLTRLLSSRVKAEVFRLLFGVGARELHGREIARQAGLNDATVRQELKKLAGLRLVSARRDGNRAYYRADPAHPLYPEIRNLVLKTSGLGDVLRQALDKSPVRVAFVFGSIADGSERPESDVDLMVVGSLSLRQASTPLAVAASRLGREINPHVLNPHEFARRKRDGDHFLTSVLRGPKLFVIGNDDELEGVGR
ncbi:MAG: nucleotidyltransferase domain-containing protein [Planctomycetes bacterium]|nr:nucleotidyltransferase domain-containing protein [Planctomycetota bacterium]MBI3847673.1 nucleotidyltransferase domain-containing protein [Planctomycetota bacterium]